MVNLSTKLTEANGTVVTDDLLLTLPAGECVTVNFTWTAIRGQWTCIVDIVSVEVFDVDQANQTVTVNLNIMGGKNGGQGDVGGLIIIFGALLIVGMIPPIAFAVLHSRVRKRRRQLARRALVGARDHIRTVEEFGIDATDSYRVLARAESAYASGALDKAMELSRSAKESAMMALGTGGKRS
jgi:hypothetical protein